MAPPFRKGEIDIYFGKGISWSASLLDSAVKHGIIDKRGAWFTCGEEKVGQGKENAVAFIESNPDFAARIEQQVREIVFPNQVAKEKAPESKSKKAEKETATEKETPDGLF